MILGFDEFVDIFWAHYKIGLLEGDISMHFKVFFLGDIVEGC